MARSARPLERGPAPAVIYWLASFGCLCPQTTGLLSVASFHCSPSPSLSAVYPLYISLPPPLHLTPCPPSPPSVPSFSSSPSVCGNPLFLSSHPSASLPSRSCPFPPLIDTFPSSTPRSLHHACSLLGARLSALLFRPLFHRGPGASPRPPSSPTSLGGFASSSQRGPQVSLAVLVRPGVWVKAARDGVLRAQLDGTDGGGGGGGRAKLNFDS